MSRLSTVFSAAAGFSAIAGFVTGFVASAVGIDISTTVLLSAGAGIAGAIVGVVVVSRIGAGDTAAAEETAQPSEPSAPSL